MRPLGGASCGHSASIFHPARTAGVARAGRETAGEAPNSALHFSQRDVNSFGDGRPIFNVSLIEVAGHDRARPGGPDTSEGDARVCSQHLGMINNHEEQGRTPPSPDYRRRGNPA